MPHCECHVHAAPVCNGAYVLWSRSSLDDSHSEFVSHLTDWVGDVVMAHGVLDDSHCEVVGQLTVSLADIWMCLMELVIFRRFPWWVRDSVDSLSSWYWNDRRNWWFGDNSHVSWLVIQMTHWVRDGLYDLWMQYLFAMGHMSSLQMHTSLRALPSPGSVRV